MAERARRDEDAEVCARERDGGAYQRVADNAIEQRREHVVVGREHRARGAVRLPVVAAAQVPHPVSVDLGALRQRSVRSHVQEDPVPHPADRPRPPGVAVDAYVVEDRVAAEAYRGVAVDVGQELRLELGRREWQHLLLRGEPGGFK